MIFFFDYVWFRIAKLYIKTDSDGITASAFLGLSQGIFIGDIVHLFNNYIGRFRGVYQAEVGIILVLIAFNYFKFKKKYWNLRQKYVESKNAAFIKGILVFIVLVFPLILAIVLIENSGLRIP